MHWRLTLTAGKFDDETGMCTFYLNDGEKVFINYKGKGTGGVGGSGDFVIIGGTGNMKTFQEQDFQADKILKAKWNGSFNEPNEWRVYLLINN